MTITQIIAISQSEAVHGNLESTIFRYTIYTYNPQNAWVETRAEQQSCYCLCSRARPLRFLHLCHFLLFLFPRKDSAMICLLNAQCNNRGVVHGRIMRISTLYRSDESLFKATWSSHEANTDPYDQIISVIVSLADYSQLPSEPETTSGRALDDSVLAGVALLPNFPSKITFEF